MAQGRHRAEESVGGSMRTFKFVFTLECQGEGDADRARLEELLDLHLKDFIYDDEVISVLDEKTAVSISLTPILDK